MSLGIHPVRLTPGMSVTEELLLLREKFNLSACFILSCVGSVSKATLRLAKPPPELADKERVVTFHEYFEILALNGTVSKDGEHLHVTLGRHDGSVISGHVFELIVFTTAEIVLGNVVGCDFSRKLDSTGFPELVVTKTSESDE